MSTIWDDSGWITYFSPRNERPRHPKPARKKNAEHKGPDYGIQALSSVGSLFDKR